MDNFLPIALQLAISFIPAVCLIFWLKLSFIEETNSFRTDHRRTVSETLGESVRIKLIITSAFLFFQSLVVAVFAADAFVFVFVLSILVVNFTAIVCLWTDYSAADQVVDKIRASRSTSSMELLKSEVKKFVELSGISIDSLLARDDSDEGQNQNSRTGLLRYMGILLLTVFPFLAVSWIFLSYESFVFDFLTASSYKSLGVPIIDSILAFALANYGLGTTCSVGTECTDAVRDFVNFTKNTSYRLVLFSYFFCMLFPMFRLLSSLKEYRSLLNEGNTGDLGLETDVVQTLGLIFSVVFTAAVALILIQVPIGEIGIFGGVLAAGLSLAMKDTLGNLMAGALLIWDGSLKKGDVITIPQTVSNDTGSTYGIIREMKMRYTVVEDRNTVRRLIPNSILVTDPIESWTHEHNSVRLSLQIGVAYDTDLLKAKQIMESVCYDVSRIMIKRPPQALVVNYGDNSIDFSLRFWLRDTKAGIRPVISDVLMGVKQRFDDEGIVIPFPQQDLWIRNENLSTVASFGKSEKTSKNRKTES